MNTRRLRFQYHPDEEMGLTSAVGLIIGEIGLYRICDLIGHRNCEAEHHKPKFI